MAALPLDGQGAEPAPDLLLTIPLTPDHTIGGEPIALEYYEPARAQQIETLRRLVAWFWHDLSHFITALGRGQLWSAYGHLEELRRSCVNLARLRQNFVAAADGYEKVEQTLPIEQLTPLQAILCLPKRDAMLQAAYSMVRYYQELAPLLARTHGLPYPDGLDHIMVDRLAQLGKTGVS